MKLKSFILIIVLFLVALQVGGVEGWEKNYTNSFFGVYGKGSMVMGRVDGSAQEIWIYPFKVLHDFRFTVFVEGAEENPYERLGSYRFSPALFQRDYIGETWTLQERLFPAYDQPCVFLVYRIRALEDITLEFSFKPDLSPMWPASLGGKYSYWDDGGYFVLSEATGKNRAFIGGFPGKKLGRLPAHKLPGGKLRYRIDLQKGVHEIPLCAYAGRGKHEDLKGVFAGIKGKAGEFLSLRKQAFKAFYDRSLKVETPVPWINEALAWGMVNLHTAFVDNPDLGEGLIAGYGLSGDGERPGFGWYFGGDGLINAFALVDTGDFAGAKQELEFLLKYQRDDGKIMHELSQGAAFVDWFGDYGFPFFHGDTTLYFASFLDYYIQRTGDRAFLEKHRKKIDRLFSWMKRVDSDGDGVVESRLAGTGASETGPLRQEMKTDIFLASLSVKAWRSMFNIYSLLGHMKNAALARSRSSKAEQSLDRMFWDEERDFYAYAVKEDGSQIKETTIWPAIGMRFGVMPPDKGGTAGKKIASPELSADWGTRFLGSQSKYYNPSSYNNGAVWPFLTGFSSLALYNYGNPYFAYSLLEANLRIVMDFDYGAPTELLSGDIYRPLDQSVPNHVWSSGNTLSAFVEGLLGFAANALEKKIVFKPALPLTWDHLRVENLKVGKGNMSVVFRRKGGELTYDFHFNGLKGYTFSFDPLIPAREKKIVTNGVGDRGFALSIDADDQEIAVGVRISGYLYPYVDKKMIYGQSSRQPVIEGLRRGEDDGFILDVWGRGESRVYLVTDLEVACPEAEVEKKGEKTVLRVTFKDKWERKSLPLAGKKVKR